MRVDLHLHSWVSDGDVSPAEVVRLAARARLDVIALTDHDTAAGVAEAAEEARSLALSVVPGIEISTRWGDRELHILGYWIDPTSEPILEHQRRAGQRRANRMRSMIQLLEGMGVEVTMDDVEAAAGTEVRTLGRPHLARALFARGHTRFYGEAFTRFIGDGGPAHVAEGFPDPEYAIGAIHDAGGAAVWAHPPVEWFEEGLELLAGWGLDGVECYRPGADPADVLRFESGSRSRSLFITGGSDWHGPQRSALGTFAVAGDRVAPLLSFGGLAV